jgi:glycosyltransferase involved in cell wall biosynthesis
MGEPLVSVIVPNYNYAPALRLCLESLLAQTYPNLEIIVVDDCSTDDSPEVAASYGVTVVKTPANCGAAGARNVGAEAAHGEIYFFIDSDVAAKPDAVANAVELLRADPQLGAVCGNYDPVPLIRDSLLEEYRCLQQSYWLIADEGRITTLYTALLAIPATVFAEIGPFRADLRETENADYGLRLARRHPILLSARVRGVHDHDDKWSVLVRKVFQRTMLHMPLYIHTPDFPGGITSSARSWVSIAAAATVAAIAAPVLLGWPYIAVPLLLLVVYLAGDAPMYAFVRRQRGWGFLAYFTAMHFILNLVIATAAATGAVVWLASADFRALYDPPVHNRTEMA